MIEITMYTISRSAANEVKQMASSTFQVGKTTTADR